MTKIQMIETPRRVIPAMPTGRQAKAGIQKQIDWIPHPSAVGLRTKQVRNDRFTDSFEYLEI